MPDQPLFIVAALACLVVLAVLATGIGSFGRGGDFHRRNSNRLMRLRIITQAIAVAVVVLYVAVRGA